MLLFLLFSGHSSRRLLHQIGDKAPHTVRDNRRVAVGRCGCCPARATGGHGRSLSVAAPTTFIRRDECDRPDKHRPSSSYAREMVRQPFFREWETSHRRSSPFYCYYESEMSRPTQVIAATVADGTSANPTHHNRQPERT